MSKKFTRKQAESQAQAMSAATAAAAETELNEVEEQQQPRKKTKRVTTRSDELHDRTPTTAVTAPSSTERKQQHQAALTVQRELIVRLEEEETGIYNQIDQFQSEITVLQKKIHANEQKIQKKEKAAKKKRDEITDAENKVNQMHSAYLELMDSPSVNKSATLICRDSLRVVFSFLSSQDWKETQMWRTCNWWYQSTKKHTSQKLEYTLPELVDSFIEEEVSSDEDDETEREDEDDHDDGNDGYKFYLQCSAIHPEKYAWNESNDHHEQSSLASSPLRHHFTRVKSHATQNSLELLSKFKWIEELTLRRPSNYSRSLFKRLRLIPLRTLEKLTHLTLKFRINSKESMTTVKQLPSLRSFGSKTRWTQVHLNDLTAEPTNCGQWTEFDVRTRRWYYDKPMFSQFVSHFSSLERLNFGYQRDPEGALGKLTHLRELTFEPVEYSFPLEKQHQVLSEYCPAMTNITQLTLRLHGIKKSVNHLALLLVSAQCLTHLTILEGHSADVHLTDLSCLNSLTQTLTHLTLVHLDYLTPASLRQLSSLTQLQELHIRWNSNKWANFDSLAQFTPDMMPPSTIVPSLRVYSLRASTSEELKSEREHYEHT